MILLGYEIKNKALAALGAFILIYSLFLNNKYGMPSKIFLGVIGFAFVGLSTGNQKFLSELKAIIIIVLIALSVKVTLLEAYIVPTGSMEKTIMTGDFLIGSRFVYGLRTPEWVGIPYTDIGVFIPSFQLPKFKVPEVGDVLIFKYPRDKYVKYVKRCIAGPGDTIKIHHKQVYINGSLTDLPENFVFSQKEIPISMKQREIYLSSETNINKDNMGPIVIPKKGYKFDINANTNWRELLPIMMMDGNTAKLVSESKSYDFTLQDPFELHRRKDHPSVFEPYFGWGEGNLITPWSTKILDSHFEFLEVNGKAVKELKVYEVKQDYYWAMGDNRDDSLDSRYWGLIPEKFILGEALFAYFSLDLRTWIPRLNRIGTLIN
ncbi:signal peptidase I [Candidatus Marinimicrobia bacterium]|nr:signal peptidase I [Candidatus Neomarinimicrobiota bacterium]